MSFDSFGQLPNIMKKAIHEKIKFVHFVDVFKKSYK